MLQLSTWDTACGIADYTGSLRNELVDLGVEVDVWPVDRIANNYRSRPEIDESFQQFTDAASSYDVVHIQHEFSFFSGSYGSKTSMDVFASAMRRLRKSRPAVVTTFHTHPAAIEPKGRQRWSLPTAMYFRTIVGSTFRGPRGATAIAHNRLTRRALIDRGVPLNRVNVIPIGVPPMRNIDAQERANAKRALGLPTVSTVLGMFGFLTESKGLLTALEAMAVLPENFHLLIVGGPHPQSPTSPLDEMLQWLHDQPSVAPRVHLAGYVDAAQVPDFLSAVDVNLAPYEEFPLLSSSAAITRAMASGRPIVASRIPAFIELNETAPDCLWLCSPGSPFELARRVEELIENEALTKQLALNCESYAEENSWASVAEQHVRLYESLRNAAG